MMIIGHRGAAGHAPENTLASVAKALALGVDGVEIDVYAVEGRLVVIHDDRLERTTNGRGAVAKQSVAYLRSLDAGGGEKIPFLEEVFDLVARRVLINVELKGPATEVPVVPLVREAVEKGGWRWEQILLSSFDPDRLGRAKERCPLALVGLLTGRDARGVVPAAIRMGAWSVHLPVAAVTPERVAEARGAGLAVLVYTVNTRDDFDRMRACGVDGVITDDPARLGRKGPQA